MPVHVTCVSCLKTMPVHVTCVSCLKTMPVHVTCVSCLKEMLGRNYLGTCFVLKNTPQVGTPRYKYF